MGRLLALITALIAAGIIAWLGERTPKPAPASAPATAFSAERAMIDVRGVASVPHPVGSAANRLARDYLVHRMTALGLEPLVRAGVGVNQSDRRPTLLLAGHVENIVGVLPGRDRSLPALALMAHYDSVPGSTGASDDAAGVAVALEVVRVIKARGIPARDVMVLLTDGEEAGLLGAEAFFASDPLAKRIGFLINMEARGSSGRVQMFQTSDGNGEAIRLLKRTTVNPMASSLTGFIYARMPNDTDFTVSKKAGVPGMNYAFIGGQFDYHSPTSTPATQDRGTLQELGEHVLGPALALATSPTLPARTPDLVYSQTPGGLTLAYPPVVGWVILAVSAALIGWAVMRARRRQAFPWSDLARGAGGLLFLLATGAVVLHFTRLATGAAMGFLQQRFLLAQSTLWEVALLTVGLGVTLMAAAELARGRRKVALVPLLAALGSCALIGGLDKVALIEGGVGVVFGLVAYGRPASRPGAWAGVLLLGLVIGIALQALAAPAAFIIAWPLALAALAAAATDTASRPGTTPILIAAVLGAIGLSMAASFAHGAVESLDLAELLVLPMLMAALNAWPLAQTEEGAPPARLLGPTLVLIGLAITVAVRLNDPYDARHPLVTYVAYAIDQDARKAWRYSASPTLDPWSRSVLSAAGGPIGKHRIGGETHDAAPAPYIDMPAPDISLTRTADGRLALRVIPPAGARVVSLALKSDKAGFVEAASGAPAKLALQPGKDARVFWSAAAPGFDLVIRPSGPGTLTVRYRAILEAWPQAAGPLPPRPAGVAGFDTTDSTLLTGSRRFSW